MRKFITGMAVGVMTATALLVAAPTGTAAPAKAETTYCLVQSGQTSCSSTRAAMLEMSPMAASHVLNLWNLANYEGHHVEVWRAAGDCTPESDFNPADNTFDIPFFNGTRQWVTSVRKIDTGHCNWRLIGPNGAVSTEVENDWPNLGTLGTGWNNRAVRIQID